MPFCSPSFVSVSKLCEPVGAGIPAALLFREIPAPIQLLGSVLILGGVFWYAKLEKSGEKKA